MADIFRHDLDERDWSAKHTRLKFQMVLSVLLFLILKNYEPSSVNLLVFRFSEGLPLGLLRVAILVFCIYSFFGFISRSIHEWPKGGLLDTYSIEILRDAKFKLKAANSLISDLSIKYALEKLPPMLPEKSNETTHLDETLEGLKIRFGKILALHDETRILLNAAGFEETNLYKVVENGHNEMSLLEEDWPKYLSLSLDFDKEKAESVLSNSSKISSTVLNKINSILSESKRRAISGFLEIWAFGFIVPVATFVGLLIFGDNLIYLMGRLA